MTKKLSQHEPVSSVTAGNEVSVDDISSEIRIQPTTGTSSSNSNKIIPSNYPNLEIIVVQRNVTNSLDIEDIENATENPETEPLIFDKETVSA